MDDVAVLLGGIDLSKYASAPGTSAEAEETEDSADHQDRFSSSGLPGREGGEAVGEDGEGADEEESEEEDDDARRAAQFPTISGRRALGHVPWHQRPATQGGPAGYFESSVPEHAQVKSALKRGRSILAKPGMKLFQLQDKTYRVDVETGNATLMLGRLSRTAGVDDAGFQRQKKLITVPFRKRPPKTSLGEPPVLTEPPPHLKERWRRLTNRDEVRDFEKMYNVRYKEKDVLQWRTDDVMSFIMDSFINETQVDAAGFRIPKRLLDEDGIRADHMLDVLVCRSVRLERLDGRKLLEKIKRATLASTLKLDKIDPSLADALSAAVLDYHRLNARRKLPKHEGVTAQQTFNAVLAEQNDETLIQDLMFREVELRHQRAALKNLREHMAPLQSKFSQGVDDFDSLQQHYDRLQTPDVRPFLRPKSRHGVLALKRAIDQDLTKHADEWLKISTKEAELAKAVREGEMATLALRQKAETAQQLREAKRKALWEEQMARASQVEEDRDATMLKADQMLKTCDEMIAHATAVVQTQFDRSQRNGLLRMIGDKLFAAKKMLVEAFRFHLRQKRVDALEAALEFAVDKLHEGDVHLTKVQTQIVSAAAIDDATQNATLLLQHLLSDALENFQRAKRDYRRTGALEMVKPNLDEMNDALKALDARILRLKSEAQARDRVAAAAAAQAAEEERRGTAGQLEEEEEEEEEEMQSEFDKTLGRLITEKQKQESSAAIDCVKDSLCSMQSWLFEVKAKSKAQKAASSSGDSHAAASQTSTRPASPKPWANPLLLPHVPVPKPMATPDGTRLQREQELQKEEERARMRRAGGHR